MNTPYDNTRLCFPEMPPESLAIVHYIRESRGIRLRIRSRVVAEDDGQPMSDNIARLRESV
jgi:hypothetical protein